MSARARIDSAALSMMRRRARWLDGRKRICVVVASLIMPRIIVSLGTVTTVVSFAVYPCAVSELLLINPNTTASVTALMARHVQAELGGAVTLHSLTARLGAPYIASEASYAVAQHAVLDSWAQAHAQGLRPAAVLIGCFGDPGLFALREGAGVPVAGLADAAFEAAARIGRYAIVTGGERWKPMLERLVLTLGQAPLLAGIHTVAPTGAQLAADPAGARQLLAQACREAVLSFGAEVVILGGAGLAGLAAEIQDQVPVPVIDSVRAGAQWAAAVLQTPMVAGPAGFGTAWHNVSAELQALP